MSQPGDVAPKIIERAELVEISGADALAFAHAQFASNVAGLDAASWQWSAWLNAQGRTRCVFALLRTAPDRLLVWLPLGDAAAIRDALARFVLRAKVRIEVVERWALAHLPPGSLPLGRPHAVTAHDGGHVFAQPGPLPRVAWLGPARDGVPDPAAQTSWRLADVRARLPWLAGATGDEFVPQALDLEALDAVRFDKGCFPGQEIAARLHYRGGVKQSLAGLVLRGDADAPPGLDIRGDEGRAGTILYSATTAPHTHEALAVMSDASRGLRVLQSDAGHVVDWPDK